MKLFIFGSTGDLVRRKVLPALQQINTHRDLRVIALGRKSFIQHEYRQFVCNGQCTPEFEKKISYMLVDFENDDICVDCWRELEKDQINYFYISLPPSLLSRAVEGIGKIKRKGFLVKILAEKPFGENFAGAQKLLKTIKEQELLDDFLISDHYLFKENILNAKPKVFSKLKIVSLELLGTEGRKHYNEVGAVRDMVQSHFFNIMFHFDPTIKKIIVEKATFGQYDGFESEVGKPTETETFVHAHLKTDKGQEIEFITGKAFHRKQAYFEIDGENHTLLDLKSPYVTVFELFFDNKRHCFPTKEQSILAWEMTEEILAHKKEVIKYEAKKDLDSLPKELRK